MPKKSAERAPWEVHFINLNLSRTQIEEAKTWDKDYAKTLKTVEDVLVEGCKLSLTYQANTGSVIAACTVPSPQTGVDKRCFTSHAPTALEALKMFAYKVESLLDGQVSSVHDRKQSGEAFG